jgi:ABC-type sugar transport system permease subunit
VNGPIARRGAIAGWLMLAPWLLLFAVFTMWPLAMAGKLAGSQTFGPGASTGVGFANFRDLAEDPLFLLACKNTVLYTLGSVFIQLPLALGLALLLNRPDIRARAWFRLIIFSPALVGAAFSSMMFAVILEKRTGLMNLLLNRLVGLDVNFPWLERHILPALIIASLWQWTGFNMVYFLAALQNVRQDLLEAARLDGAGPIRRFWLVIMPAIRPVAGFVVLLSIIGSMQLFELPYIMLSSSGGPENRGLTIVMYLFQMGFESGNLGYASAIGWVLAVVLIGLAVVQRKVSGDAEAGA